MYKTEAIFTLESIFNLGRALGSANTAEEIIKSHESKDGLHLTIEEANLED